MGVRVLGIIFFVHGLLGMDLQEQVRLSILGNDQDQLRVLLGTVQAGDSDRILGSALSVAADRGSVAAAQVVLDYGRDLDAYYNGSAALHTAAAMGRNVFVQWLLQNNVNVNTQLENQTRVTPLHMVIKTGQCCSDDSGLCGIDLLCQGAANVDARTGAGETPLHTAAFFRNNHAAERLLFHRADSLVIDHRGRRPIDLAQGDEMRRIIQRSVPVLRSLCRSAISQEELAFEDEPYLPGDLKSFLRYE